MRLGWLRTATLVPSSDGVGREGLARIASELPSWLGIDPAELPDGWCPVSSHQRDFVSDQPLGNSVRLFNGDAELDPAAE